MAYNNNETTTNTLDYTIVSETIFRNAVRVGKFKYAEIPIELLNVDTPYQRERNGEARKLLKYWNDGLCDAVLTSYRDGVFHVIDGQGRINASKMRGERSVPCKILCDLSMIDEAELFAKQNIGTVALSGYDRFKAMLVSGNEVAIGIKEVCDEFGVEIRKASNNSTGVLRAFCTVESLYARHGKECLHWIFQTIEEIGWHNVKKGYCETVVASLRNVYTRTCEEDMDVVRNRIVEYASGSTPTLVVAEALCGFKAHTQIEALTSLFMRVAVNMPLVEAA